MRSRKQSTLLSYHLRAHRFPLFHLVCIWLLLVCATPGLFARTGTLPSTDSIATNRTTPALLLTQITGQPTSQTACTRAIFSVTAVEATTYRWQIFDGTAWINLANKTPYVGVTSATLFITALAGLDGKQYRAIVTGTTSETSTIATLTVGTIPQQVSLTAGTPTGCNATTLNLTASTSTTGSSYRFGGPGVVSQNTASPLAVVNANGLYSVTVTSASGCPASATTTVAGISDNSDYAALVDFYNSTNGNGWTLQNGAKWFTTCNPCEWSGIQCTNGRVSGLTLLGSNLTGTLPNALGNLTELEVLWIPWNLLTGSIPTSIGDLTKLKYVYLSNNQLTGSIPASLGNLANLHTISLADNQLTGSIPDVFDRLTSLRFFLVANNQLSGSIPASFSALTAQSTSVNFSNNQLSGCFPARMSSLCRSDLYVGAYSNPGLPGGGDWAAFCATGAGSDAFQASVLVGNSVACAGNVVSLTATGGSSYTWAAPAGVVLNDPETDRVMSATLTVDGPQTFTVIVGNGGTCTKTITATVGELTTPAFGTVAGQTVAAGLTSVTVAQHTTAVSFGAGNCSGLLTWQGNGQSGTGTLSVPTSATGVFIYSATCSSGACVSSPASVTLTVIPVTQIVSHPIAQSSVVRGTTVTVSVGATGGEPLTYQWVKNNSFLVGQTSATLSLTNVQVSDSGSYSCLVSSAYSSVTSTAFVLIVDPATIRYVRLNATGNGSSWTSASGNIQAMIDASALGEQVWVATGTYKPTACITCTENDRGRSFSLVSGVSVYGGFVGSEVSLTQRLPITGSRPSSTTLSGDIGTSGEQNDNSFHVVLNQQVDSTGVLDGFVIKQGFANGSNLADQSSGYGGGILNNGRPNAASNPTFRNCWITGNTALLGGAVFNNGNGAGSASSPQFSSCRFTYNTATRYGGAIYSDGTSGGVTRPVFLNCLVVRNLSLNGAAIATAAQEGTGSPVFINSTIANNSPAGQAPAASGPANALVANQLTLINCIVWNSTLAFDNFGLSLAARYSNLDQSGFAGINGNLSSYPLFVDVATDDFRLSANSPLINQGDPAITTALSNNADLSGQPRFSGNRIDMGAFEYQEATDLYSVKNGSWTDPATWSVNRIPIAGDKVQVRHLVTTPDNYQAYAFLINYSASGRLHFGINSLLILAY